jgi:hypothetical protein
LIAVAVAVKLAAVGGEVDGLAVVTVGAAIE